MPTKTDYLIMGVGAFTAVLLTSYVPSLMKVMSMQEVKDDYASCPGCKEELEVYPPSIEDYLPMSIELVPGIDTESLRIARQKGMI